MKTNLLFSCWTLPFVCAPVFTVSAHDGAKQHETNGQKPNILLIVTDQQSFNMVSCAGNRYIHTPNLDRIAQNGYMFNNTYCANPVSMPSRFALITGQFSSKVGIKGNTTKVNREKVLETVHQYSIGNVFRANGYNTYYSGKTHLYAAKSSLDDYGFELHGQDPYEGAAAFAESFFANPDYTSGKPFFLYLSFMNPHDICYGAGEDPRFKTKELSARNRAATEKYLKMKKEMPREEFLSQVPPQPSNMNIIPEYNAKLSTRGSGFRDWNEEQWMTYRWMYRKLTEDVDSLIGRVLNALDKADLTDNTIVVFTSDHGDMQQAHGFVFKSRLLEECQKVPFIFMGKGIRKGVKDDQTLVCNGSDLAPTLYDLAGIEAPDGLPGLSLKSCLTGHGTRPDRKYLILESSPGMQMHDGKYKYSVLMDMGCTETLFDISTDPGEQYNIVREPQYQDIRKRMRAVLEKEARLRGRVINVGKEK